MTEPSEKTIDIFPIPQRTGKVMDGGDCGYCCVGGIFKTSSILSAYEMVEDAMPKDGGWKQRQSMFAYRMKWFLESKGMEYKEFNPEFDYYKTGMMTYPWNNHNWFAELKKLLEDGLILFASIRYDKSAPPAPKSGVDHDHVVLVNGYREFYKDHATVKGARYLATEIRVACSAKGSYWIDWKEFLYWHGCAATIIEGI